MKKKIIAYFILCNLIAGVVFGNEFKDLKSRLNKITEFHAHFTQKVIDKNGNLLQEGRGELWVKRPNFFNWHITYPYENILISDGKTLWFYTPILKQATAISLRDATKNTPLMLIFRNQLNDWKWYNVKKMGNNFTLIPKNNNSSLKKFSVEITFDGKIHHFSTIEQNNQINRYQLILQKNRTIDASKFVFIPPNDVTIDDQRNK